MLSAVLLLSMVSILPGQTIDSSAITTPGNKDIQKPDSFVQFMNNYINLKLGHTSDIDELSVLTDENDLFLSPNATSISRVYFNYKFISFSIAYVPKWLPGNDDNELKGDTKSGGFGLNLIFSKWLQEVSYSKTKGYFLENTSDYVTGWKEGDPFIQFPNLEFKNFQGSTAYKFNRNFSLNAVASQTERQLKSAGSFMPALLYRYYLIDNKTPQTTTGSSQKSNNFEVILGAGYYHTFVLKHNFYFSLGAAPGIGVVFTKLTTRYPAGEEEVTHQKNNIFRIDGRAGAGYNGERFFTGIYSKVTASSFNQQNTSVINQDARVVIQGFIGYRLNAPKWMRDKVQTVEKMVPF